MGEYVKLQTRRDSASNWETYNPVLYLGEIGIDTTNNRAKVGDNVHKWKELPYLEGGDTVIRVKVDTSDGWESADPVLGAGELGYDSMTNKLKCGDGEKTWTDLPYIDDEDKPAQIRVDTSENWNALDPVLEAGELGLTTTTNRLKCGDGESKWSELEFITPRVVDSYLGTHAEYAMSENAGHELYEQIKERVKYDDITNDLMTNASRAVASAKTVFLLNRDKASYDDIVTLSVAALRNKARSDFTLKQAAGARMVKDLLTYADTLTGGGGVEIYDGLDGSDDESREQALSAYQGYVLKGLLDGKADASALTTLQNTVNGHTTEITELQTTVNNLHSVTVEDVLTSTSTANALSANQGRVLKGLVDSKASQSDLTTLQNTVNTHTTKITALETTQNNLTSEEWTFTLSTGVWSS